MRILNRNSERNALRPSSRVHVRKRAYKLSFRAHENVHVHVYASRKIYYNF